MKRMKKLAAMLLAGVMALSVSACSTSDTSWIAKDGEYQLPAGVYLYNLMQNYYMAHYMASDMSKDVLDQKIEEKDAAVWVEEKAMDSTKYDMAVMKKFQELGLTLTEEEKGYAKTQVNRTWEADKATIEKNGISKETMILLAELSIMDTRIFDAIYGEGGEKAVSNEELKKTYEENYLKAGMITFRLPSKPAPPTETPATGEEADPDVVPEDAPPTPEEQKAAEEEYNTSLLAVKSEADDWFIKGQAAESAKKDFNDIINLYNKEQSPTPDAYDMTTNNFTLIDIKNSSYDDKVLEELKKAKVGQTVKIETEDQIIITVRKDILEFSEDFEGVKETIIHSLKDKEYLAMMNELKSAASVEINQDSVKRYTAKKIKLQ